MGDHLEHLERPQVTPRARLHPNHLYFGETVPPADAIDIASIDLSDPELWRQDKAWDRLARMRDEAPVHMCADSPFGPYWSITRYEDIVAVDTDHTRFSSDSKYGGVTLGPLPVGFVLQNFITMDEPEHGEVRRTVQPGLAPKAISRLAGLIRQRTVDVLDRLPVGKPFDWVERVSIELTSLTLATLLDFPIEERAQLIRWSDVTTNGANPDVCPGGMEQRRRELLECLDTFTDLYKARQTRQDPNDLLSLLATSDRTNSFSPMELLGNVILLIVGGNDTTRNSMTGSVYFLDRFQDQFARLKANPDLIPNLVSEAIRFQTPLNYMRRTATEDVTMHDKTISAGDQVVMWYVSGNRDPRAIENPDAFWIERPRPRQHLSFGFGVHRCIGNRLAEMQLRILWEEVLARFSRLEVVEEPSRTAASFVHGYTWMPVICHPR